MNQPAIQTVPVLQPRTDMIFALSEHLLNGKLGHKEFNFYFYNHSYKGNSKPEKCLDCGCAIGELPIIFPCQFYFDGNKVKSMKNHIQISLAHSLRSEFSLEENDAYHLHKIFHDFSLYPEAVKNVITKEMVAHKLFAFATELESKYDIK